MSAITPSRLRFAINLGNAVLAHPGENGEPTGITPELSHRLAQRWGVVAEFVTYPAAGRGLRLFRQHLETLQSLLFRKRQLIEKAGKDKAAELLPFEKAAPDMDVPLLKRHKIGNIHDVVFDNPVYIRVIVALEIYHHRGMCLADYELVVGKVVIPDDRVRRNDIPVSHADRTDHAALAPEKNRRLVEHNTAGNVPYQ